MFYWELLLARKCLRTLPHLILPTPSDTGIIIINDEMQVPKKELKISFRKFGAMYIYG